MEMFVYGNPIDTLASEGWFVQDSSNVDLLFRLGKDDDFYELRQPIFSEWDSKNHVKINLDELTRYKLNINSSYSLVENTSHLAPLEDYP